jgi:hypothetical protein
MPAMKAPPRFKTGDPSYFVLSSTFGSASPTVLTISNASARGLFGFSFIEVESRFLRDAIQSNVLDIGQR